MLASRSSGDSPIWPAYCDGGTGLFTNIPSTFITVWVPALLVTIWQGSILPLLVYLLVQVIRGGRSHANCFNARQCGWCLWLGPCRLAEG